MKPSIPPLAPAQTVRFLHRGQPVTVGNVPPERTLLDLLREDLGLTATKEGCGEGDCGACSVVLSEWQSGELTHRVVNSCIRLAHSVQGMAVSTAADLAAPDGALHPAQSAMVRCHGSQCGFCTPGFVMSLWALYQDTQGGKGIRREQAQAALSGNLCRCTGYRSILEAATEMHALALPPACEKSLVAMAQGLEQLHTQSTEPEPKDPDHTTPYLRPRHLEPLLQARAQHPQAQLVAGCTDVGLWIIKGHQRFARIIDLSATRELLTIDTQADTLDIGAAVNLSQAFAALVADRPELLTFTQRFAGLAIRNSGTLGGNIANGSPIGDSMPLLIALGATVVLARWDGTQVRQRELALEDFYLGYRQNVLQADEVLTRIHVPRHAPHKHLKVFKVSKRRDDDISAVCLALELHVHDGRIQSARVGVGGVAATPVRARATEAALLGAAFDAASLERAAEVLAQEFSPISDMRASAAYRRTLLRNLLRRAALEWGGKPLPRVQDLHWRDLENV